MDFQCLVGVGQSKPLVQEPCILPYSMPRVALTTLIDNPLFVVVLFSRFTSYLLIIYFLLLFSAIKIV